MHSILQAEADSGKLATIPAIVSAGSLATLAERINAEHHQAEAALNDGLQHALQAGRLLREAKAELDHGEWSPWLKQNFEGSKRTAQVYMRLTVEVRKLPTQKRNAAALSLRQAIASTTKPTAAVVKQVASEIIAAPERVITTEPEQIIDVATPSVTCPNCGGSEVDADGDCAACKEPHVGTQENVVTKPAPPKRTGQQRDPVGVILANEALNVLMRIPKDDPLRKRGFQIVTDWIRREARQP